MTKSEIPCEKIKEPGKEDSKKSTRKNYRLDIPNQEALEVALKIGTEARNDEERRHEIADEQAVDIIQYIDLVCPYIVMSHVRQMVYHHHHYQYTFCYVHPMEAGGGYNRSIGH